MMAGARELGHLHSRRVVHIPAEKYTQISMFQRPDHSEDQEDVSVPVVPEVNGAGHKLNGDEVRISEMQLTRQVVLPHLSQVAWKQVSTGRDSTNRAIVLSWGNSHQETMIMTPLDSQIP
jgi:hypothetical protein